MFIIIIIISRGAPDLDPDPAGYENIRIRQNPDPAGSKHYGSGPTDSCVTNLPTTVSMHYVFFIFQCQTRKQVTKCSSTARSHQLYNYVTVS